ncbi:phosphohistidine phosphatase [Intoshia linei]|uniref:Phosphohistidine phosphatase n=1 Tax=Intoshia linei TaxID=1819745 RepID=A0A177BCX8_9BILA|nr:phosphohistidine phosphatase [Intoshia linei]
MQVEGIDKFIQDNCDCKYILIESTCRFTKEKKLYVRFNTEKFYHYEIFDDFDETNDKATNKCLGGGYLKGDNESNSLHIYGISIGYGKANHSVTSDLIKQYYSQYTIIIDD